MRATPGSKAKVKSTLVRTPEQNKALKELVAEWKSKGEDPALKSRLSLSWGRGKLVSEARTNKERYGPTTLKHLSGLLGIKESAMKQAETFYNRVSREQMKQLLEGPNILPWRRVVKALSIKDDAAFWRFLLKSMADGLDDEGFDAKLRELLEKGPAEPRRPKRIRDMLVKLDGEVDSFARRLDWLPKSFPEFNKIKDDAERDEARVALRDSAKKLQELVKRLNQLIGDCAVVTE